MIELKDMLKDIKARLEEAEKWISTEMDLSTKEKPVTPVTQTPPVIDQQTVPPVSNNVLPPEETNNVVASSAITNAK